MLKLFAAVCYQHLNKFKNHNYFDDLTKLFSDLYLAKFLDVSTKSIFLMLFLKLCRCIRSFIKFCGFSP